MFRSDDALWYEVVFYDFNPVTGTAGHERGYLDGYARKADAIYAGQDPAWADCQAEVRRHGDDTLDVPWSSDPLARLTTRLQRNTRTPARDTLLRLAAGIALLPKEGEHVHHGDQAYAARTQAEATRQLDEIIDAARHLVGISARPTPRS